LIHSFWAESVLACQPRPVTLKVATTSNDKRIVIRPFVLLAFGASNASQFLNCTPDSSQVLGAAAIPTLMARPIITGQLGCFSF
jgi:hypothetical protein